MALRCKSRMKVYAVVAGLAILGVLAPASPGRVSTTQAAAEAVAADPDVVQARGKRDAIAAQLSSIPADDFVNDPHAQRLALELQEAKDRVTHAEAQAAMKHLKAAETAEEELPDSDKGDPMFQVPAVRIYVKHEAMRHILSDRAAAAKIAYENEREQFVSAHRDHPDLEKADAEASTAGAALQKSASGPVANSDDLVAAIAGYDSARKRLAVLMPQLPPPAPTPPPVSLFQSVPTPQQTPATVDPFVVVPEPGPAPYASQNPNDTPSPRYTAPPRIVPAEQRVTQGAQQIKIPVRYEVFRSCQLDISWGSNILRAQLPAGRGEFFLTGPMAERVRNGNPVVIAVHPKLYQNGGYSPTPIYKAEVKILYSFGSTLSVRQSNPAAVQPYGVRGAVRPAAGGWTIALTR